MNDHVQALVAEQIAYYRDSAPEYDDAYLGRDWDGSIEGLPITGDVLELACGTGHWTPLLAARARSVTAVDAAPEVLALARQRVQGQPVELLEADVFTFWRLGSGHGGLSQVTVVGGLQFCRWEIADLAVEPAVVVPVDVGEGGQLDLLKRAPGAAAADQLSLDQPDGRLGQGVVVAVTNAADRRCRPDLGQSFGVADGGVLGGFNWSWQHRLLLTGSTVAR
jgi:SAM-dependent methyltransferase